MARRAGGGRSHDDFPGVEISIAAGVEKMVRVTIGSNGGTLYRGER